MTRFTSSVCLAALCASPAWAQTAAATATAEASNTIAEIVVTAQRRSETLQNVPIAITALGRRELETTLTRDTEDMKNVTPGLTFNQTAGWGLPRIRGIGTTATGPGIENPVAIYVDGVYLAAATGTMFALNDVEQIAVLKGPQGTLFGRNATGGLIQITTLQPSETPTLNGHFTAMNHKGYGADFYVAGPLASGLSASIAGIYDYQGEGFGRNLVNGEDIQDHRNYGGRAKLRWEASDATTVTLSADYTKNTSGDPSIRAVGPTLRDGQPTPGGPRDITNEVTPRLSIEAWGASMNITHDLDAVQLVSITAYRATHYQTLFDLDYTPIFGARFDINSKDKQFSQELQLQSQPGGPLQWTMGGIYFWTRAGYYPTSTLLPFATIDVTADTTLQSYAAYAQGTYALGDATNVTLGLRYTSDKRDFESARVIRPNTPTAVPIDTGASFRKLTWRAAIDHRFSPELLAYVSYNRGFKSGAFVASAFPVSLVRPEVLDAVEIGLKSDLLDRRVRVNVAAFAYDYKNAQVIQISSGFITLYNAKSARTYGVDADATFRVTPQFTLTVGGSVLHARYKSFENAVGTFPRVGGGNVVIPVDASGNRQQYTPDWTFNAVANYTIPTSFGEIGLSGNYYHNDGFYSGPENRFRQKAYDLFDASITWTHPDERFTLRLWGKNLTDELYAKQLSAVDAGDTIVAADGRTYGLTAGFRF